MIKISQIIATPDMPKVANRYLYMGEVEDNVAKVAAAGFDGVELKIGDPESFDEEGLARALEAHRLELACINSGRLMSQFGLTLLHPRKEVRTEALRKLQAMVKIAGRHRSSVNIGLFRGAALEGKPIAHTRDLFVDVLKEVCDVAGRLGVFINFEPTNRFEINFINTTDEGLDIVQRVNRPNLGLLLDLYHIYIEDADMAESIRKASGIVRHFHFADTDRLPPGVSHGEIDFASLIRLLKEVGYTGFLTVSGVPTENVGESVKKTSAFLRGLINET